MSRYLLLLILIFPFNLLIGQNYLNATSKWQTVSGDVFDSWYSVAKLEVIGDTLIEDNSYLKIQKTFNILLVEMVTQDTIAYIPFNQQVKYLREENKKFYFWNDASANPHDDLIINFDLKIGDTVGAFPTDTIERIEVLMTGGVERKVFHTYFGRTIYEGIGTNQGLFTGLEFLGDESFAFLQCYSQDGENYSLYEGWLPEVIEVPPCENLLATSIESVKTQYAIKAFPNPAGNILYLDLNLSKVEPITIEVHNLNGQQLLQKEVTTNHLIQLDISNLPKGLSVLSIKGKTFGQFIKFFKK